MYEFQIRELLIGYERTRKILSYTHSRSTASTPAQLFVAGVQTFPERRYFIAVLSADADEEILLDAVPSSDAIKLVRDQRGNLYVAYQTTVEGKEVVHLIKYNKQGEIKWRRAIQTKEEILLTSLGFDTRGELAVSAMVLCDDEIGYVVLKFVQDGTLLQKYKVPDSMEHHTIFDQPRYAKGKRSDMSMVFDPSRVDCHLNVIKSYSTAGIGCDAIVVSAL